MSIAFCKNCTSEFYVKPSWIKKGHGKYCSRVCAFDGKKKGSIVECSNCGRGVYKQKKAIEKSESGKLFCSMRCSLNWRHSKFVGEKHPNWKHGIFAYKEIINKSALPRTCVLCGIEDNNLLVAHHIDKNRKNNVIANLAWLCRNCHFLVHHHPEEEEKFLRKNRAIQKM